MAVKGWLLAAILISAPTAFSVQAGEQSATIPILAVPRTAAIAPNGSWSTYHHDNAHTGYDPSAPTLTSVQSIAGWTNTALDGEVYAEPLVFNGMVFAATLNNTVYALNQANRSVI